VCTAGIDALLLLSRIYATMAGCLECVCFNINLPCGLCFLHTAWCCIVWSFGLVHVVLTRE